MFVQFLEEVSSVATQDSSNLVLWIVLAAAALILFVGTAVLSVFGKKKNKDGRDDGDDAEN